jgi:lipoprotein-anchoring transpeptidase ErfK/SrfK
MVRMCVRSAALSAVVFLSVAALVTAQTPAPAAPPSPEPAYRFELLPNTPAELAKRFTPEQIDLLEMFNRRDREHLVRADPPVPGLIVPSAWNTDPLTYSPFPAAWPAAETYPKAILVHQPMQAFAAYERGRLVRWGPVSTGRKETPTPDGMFNLTWRARSRRSTDNEDWLLEWYFNFVNARGVSFHLFDLPGYPASHACVRLLLRDAQWLYGWGEQWKIDDTGRTVIAKGTPVVIHGIYGFGGPAPWLTLEALSVPLALPAAVTPPGPEIVQGVAVAGGSLRKDSGR